MDQIHMPTCAVPGAGNSRERQGCRMDFPGAHNARRRPQGLGVARGVSAPRIGVLSLRPTNVTGARSTIRLRRRARIDQSSESVSKIVPLSDGSVPLNRSVQAGRIDVND
jgi:hypothetical protein